MLKHDLNIDKYEYPTLKPLDQDWRWCHKYAYDILKENIISCKKMKWAALRHFKDMERDDLYFDEDAAQSVVLWFKFCPIVKGPKSGSPTILDPSQIFIAVSLMAWKWKEDLFEVDEDLGIDIQVRFKGKRRYNQLYAQVSRKYGKTTFTAGIKLYLMHKYKYGPRVYSLATKKDQAKEVWTVAKKMIKMSPRLRQIFQARANDILLPAKDGEFRALASDSNSLDGLDPIAGCLDECHAIKDRNLYGVLISAFGSNEGGEFLFSVITTAGFILDGLCTDLYKNGARVLDPEDDTEQDNYFYVIFEIDEADDWAVERNWFKSNPSMVYGRPSIIFVRSRYVEATLSVEEKGNFLTKHCNRFVNGVDKWLDLDSFRLGARDLDINDYLNKTCYIGLDRSTLSDITALPVIFPADDGGIDAFSFNLQSIGAIKNAGKYLQQIYRKAEAGGDLSVLPGAYIRNEDVKQMVRDLYNNLPQCQGVYYDPYKMKEVALDLEEEGIPMIAVSMGPGNVSEPSRKLEGLIADGLFRYNQSVLLEYAASCALLNTTIYGNSMPYRDPNAVKTDRIDPLIGVILALSGATLIKPESSIYERRGMLTI